MAALLVASAATLPTRGRDTSPWRGGCGRLRCRAAGARFGRRAAAPPHDSPSRRSRSSKQPEIGAAGFEPANLSVPGRVLYQTELRPVAPANCTGSMAVRAHELAFVDLLEDPSPVPAPAEVAQIVLLVGSRQVIPVHRGGIEETTAVGTRTPLLEAPVPRLELRMPAGFLLLATLLVALVIAGVVRAMAFLAPRLVAIAGPPEMKRSDRFRHPTASAALSHGSDGKFRSTRTA